MPAGHVRRRGHRDDITTCCHKLKIEKYALKNTPRMSKFILGVFSWRRRPACSLLAACMQGVDAGVQGVDPRMQGVDALHTASTRECARVFQWRRLHLKRNAGCMQPACRLHACCCNLQPPAYDRMQAACRLHAACMHL